MNVLGDRLTLMRQGGGPSPLRRDFDRSRRKPQSSQPGGWGDLRTSGGLPSAGASDDLPRCRAMQGGRSPTHGAQLSSHKERPRAVSDRTDSGKLRPPKVLNDWPPARDWHGSRQAGEILGSAEIRAPARTKRGGELAACPACGHVGDERPGARV